MGETPDKKNRHIVFLVHGIRTFMSWRWQLRRVLRDHQDLEVHTFYYGFFSVFRFYFWLARNRIVKRFALEYYRQVATRRPEKVSVIAHSFGTYVVWRAVQDYGLRFDTIIWSGSVVPEEASFTGWFERGLERVRLIVNDIAQRDIWVLFAKLVIPGCGAAGLLGLSGVPGGYLVERVFPGHRHRSFFTEEHYRKFWIPHLTGREEREQGSDAELLPSFRIVIAWARTLKIIINLLFIIGLFCLAVRVKDTVYAWELWLDARPFNFSGWVQTTETSSNCVGYPILKRVKFTLMAPVQNHESKFQTRVRLRLREGSKWTIVDVESFGGQVQMEFPYVQFIVSEVKPGEVVTFLVCGGTNPPAGGPFADDLVVGFSDTTRY